jgi:predicted CoA-binding protein
VNFKDGLICNPSGDDPLIRMQTDDEAVISRVLKGRTIAVVGLSKDPTKASHGVAKYLKAQGYRIVPVNPTVDEVLGVKSYKSLSEIPHELKQELDVVDVFRRSEDIPPIVDKVVAIHRKLGRPTAVWMQLGIVNEEAAQKARGEGIDVVMDRCMMVEHAARARGSP